MKMYIYIKDRYTYTLYIYVYYENVNLEAATSFRNIKFIPLQFYINREI